MGRTSKIFLAIALVIAFGIGAETWSSWRSERSGPFAYFYDPAKPEARYQQAEAAIEAFLSRPQTSASVSTFLERAVFACRPWDSQSLARYTADVGIALGQGVTCTYRSGRYFMYPKVFFVHVLFDPADQSVKHMVGEDF